MTLVLDDQDGPPPDDPDPFGIAGKTVGGKYRIDRPIGQGGMGVVYAATHVRLESRHALKFIKVYGLKDKDVFLERFLREARIGAQLKHPGIVQVQDLETYTDGATPYYMSREQVSCAKDIDGRTDIHSLGVVLYHAIAGRPIFDARNQLELIALLVSGTPVDIKRHLPLLPEHAAAVIRKCMAPDRKDRFGSMQELRAALLASLNAGDGQVRALPDARTVEAAPGAATTRSERGKDTQRAAMPPPSQSSGPGRNHPNLMLAPPAGMTGDRYGNNVFNMIDVNRDGAFEAFVGAPFTARKAGVGYVYMGSAVTTAVTLNAPDGAEGNFAF